MDSKKRGRNYSDHQIFLSARLTHFLRELSLVFSLVGPIILRLYFGPWACCYFFDSLIHARHLLLRPNLPLSSFSKLFKGV